MANNQKQIKFLSEAYCGSSHDYGIFKAEFPAEDEAWFEEHHLLVDLGFLGICKDYRAKQISIPDKKPKNKKLTEEQKAENKEKSKKRVSIEHTIGGLKRYRFLSDRLRCRDIKLYNTIAGICAGMWNISLSS